MYPLIRPLLFTLPAETSHHLTLNSLAFAQRLGLLKYLVKTPSCQPVNVMGIEFPNPIGLAAGLDKNGDYIQALSGLGFGFIEIGTITPRAQAGNPLPRLFRLPESQGIINRMGFNNEGVDYLVKQVEQANYQGILGINIGKNFDTPVENAVDDYLLCMDKVYDHADYITVNVSSPNTPGLRTLQYGEELEQLIRQLKQQQLRLADERSRYVPIALKVAPDLTVDEVKAIADVLLHHKVDGLIATNTTLSREKVAHDPISQEAGGLSGAPLTHASTAVIKQFHQHLQDNIPIIGVGGIVSAEDAADKLAAGASLVQLYSGLIYQGPRLVSDCVQASC